MSEPAAMRARPYAFPDLAAAPGPARPPTAAELESVQARAYAEAWAKGHEAGLESGRAAVAEAVARLDAIASALAAPLRAVDESILVEMRDLALAVGETLARTRLSQDPEALLALIAAAIRELPESGATGGNGGAQRPRVWLHPLDRAALPPDVSLPETVSWHDDATLARGDARLDRGDEALDARLSTRAAELLRHWLEASPQ